MIVLKSEFYKRYCRVCGSNSGVCVDLFTDEGKNYLSKVQTLLNIEISKADQLPKNICHMCISFVCDLNKFLNHCNTVQIKLSNLASHLSENKEGKRVVKSTKRPSNNTASRKKIFSTETNRCDNVRNDIDSKKFRPADEDLNKCVENENKESVMLDSIDDLDPNEPRTKPEPEITKCWTVQTLPTKNTTLYICNQCSEIFLRESAIRSHQCNIAAVPKATKVLSSNKLLPQENEDLKTKKERISYIPRND